MANSRQVNNDMDPGKRQLSGYDDKVPPVELWPVDRLVRHPQNRIVNTRTERFAELLASVKAVGVIEPLTVRETQEVGVLQILSGERRFTAAVQAGRQTVPVRNFGRVPDDVAYRMVVVGNLHEDLTPLEEGQRAAALLDHYQQDAAAVASLLGKSPSWVVQRAQIARGLSADWQKEIAEALDYEERPKWRHWTAGHLAVIARLPAALQAGYLNRTRTDYRLADWPDITIRDLEDEVRLDLLYLAKAPFDEGSCHDCVNRTDRQPLLWGETAEAATGDKARCLDKKCWDRKAAQAARAEFQARAEAVCTTGRPDLDPKTVVPLSLVEPPKDTWSSKYQDYRAAQSALKKTFPKLVTADRATIVTEKTEGAVPAIVVAGKGKGYLKWVKVAEKKERPQSSCSRAYQPTAAEIERQKERERWEKVEDRWRRHLARQPMPAADKVLLLMLFFEVNFPWGQEREKLIKAVRQAVKKYPGETVRAVVEWFWQTTRDSYCVAGIQETLSIVGPVFGFDAKAAYADVLAQEKDQGKEDQPATACPVATGTGECVSDGNCKECERSAVAPKTTRGQKGPPAGG